MKLVLELKARGRPRMGMIDDLVEESYGVMKRRAENRDDWREFWSQGLALEQRTNDDDENFNKSANYTSILSKSKFHKIAFLTSYSIQHISSLQL